MSEEPQRLPGLSDLVAQVDASNTVQRREWALQNDALTAAQREYQARHPESLTAAQRRVVAAQQERELETPPANPATAHLRNLVAGRDGRRAEAAQRATEAS